MIFGQNKAIEQIQFRIERLEAFLQGAEQKREQAVKTAGADFAAFSAALQAADEKHEQIEERLAAKLAALTSAANRHDMAIEDLLDSWEELQKEQDEEHVRLQGELTNQARKELREAEQREEALLRLALDCHDQIFALTKASAEAGDASWGRQLALVDRKLSEARLPAGLQPVWETAVPVEYALHEVIALAETEDPTLDQCIAEVYACGYVYRGTVLRKARVSAYRLQRPNGEAAEREYET